MMNFHCYRWWYPETAEIHLLSFCACIIFPAMYPKCRALPFDGPGKADKFQLELLIAQINIPL
jgi:hypothetical protein